MAIGGVLSFLCLFMINITGVQTRSSDVPRAAVNTIISAATGCMFTMFTQQAVAISLNGRQAKTGMVTVINGLLTGVVSERCYLRGGGVITMVASLTEVVKGDRRQVSKKIQAAVVRRLLLDGCGYTAVVRRLLLDGCGWTAVVGRLWLDGCGWTAVVGRLWLDGCGWTAAVRRMRLDGCG